MRVKDIPGFEGLYLVTDTGFIISVYRQWRVANGQLQMQRSLVMSCSSDERGYRRVKLVSLDGRVRRALVHVLVAEAFCEPYSGEVVNHIDGDGGNNHYTNLEWCSQSANVFHGNLRRKQIRLTGMQIMEIKQLFGELPVSIIAERFKINVGTVYNVVNGGRKKR